MADSTIIPDTTHIATHNSLPHCKKLRSVDWQLLKAFAHLGKGRADSRCCVHRKGRGGISPSAVRQIHAPISGREAINSPSASSYALSADGGTT